MNKTIIIFCALAAIASAACSEERTKMPWEDDLNNNCLLYTSDAADD